MSRPFTTEVLQAHITRNLKPLRTDGLDNTVIDHISKTLNLTNRRSWTKKSLASLPSQPYLQVHRNPPAQYHGHTAVDILRLEKLYSKLASSNKTLRALFHVVKRFFIELIPVPHAGVTPRAYK